ncbi:MAG: zf-HC2 domain-containing protein [Candidatus Cloacimonetes bacterium]|nr:zf-HC2 domain-containing protein [Candidatus Cloacimonadota bacterium]MCK9185742.1 zf-HC2 domain-containing protein [Candidatus Cloacimonadota bacterium]
MRCKKAERYISLKQDNELSARQQKALQNHLQKCSSCTQIQSANLALQARLKELPQAEFPPWLHHRIIANLPQQKKQSWAGRQALSYATASLAIIFSLLAGTLVGIKGYESTEDTSAINSQSETEYSYLSFGEQSLIEVYDD